MIRKQILTVVVLLSALLSVPVQADNYFTMGENDTLWVSPSEDVQCPNLPVGAHFDGRLNQWYVSFDVPSVFEYHSMSASSGMTVPYVNSTGDATTLDAVLMHNITDSLAASSTISIPGYWDYNEDGIYESYGTVKWEAGDYSKLFVIRFTIPSSFTGGTITLRGWVNSSYDSRGGTVNNSNGAVSFTRTITVKVGYRRGDVNGDEHVSMDDITALINYLAGIIDLDAYQLEAADMNGNGTVNLDDLTALINHLVYNQGMSLDELNEVLNGGMQSS